MNKYKLQVTGFSYKYILNTLNRNKIELYYIQEEKNKLINKLYKALSKNR